LIPLTSLHPETALPYLHPRRPFDLTDNSFTFCRNTRLLRRQLQPACFCYWGRYNAFHVCDFIYDTSIQFFLIFGGVIFFKSEHMDNDRGLALFILGGVSK
jgi:hypothetical protein